LWQIARPDGDGAVSKRIGAGVVCFLPVKEPEMMKRLTTLAILIVVSASLPLTRADDKEKAKDKDTATEKVGVSPYYPLKVGNAWNYTATGGATLVNKVAAHEKIGDVMCAKIETWQNNAVIAHEHIGVTADGIYRYTLNGAKVDKPILLLKLPPKDGDEWKIETKFGNEAVTGQMKTTKEALKVPAGNYPEAFVAGGKIDAGGQSITAFNSFVKDVGIARIKMEVGGQTIDIELTKFEPSPEK
jgi:hypothetical protein